MIIVKGVCLQGDKQIVFDKIDFSNYYTKTVVNESYIVLKFISFRQINGLSFDKIKIKNAIIN